MSQEDSLFSLNTSVGSLKVYLDETSLELKNAKRKQDSVLERIEKLENESVLLKDEFEGKIEGIGKELGGFKDKYLQESAFKEYNTRFKEIFNQEG